MDGILYLKDFLYGVILGITNIIPGISGGTMAVLLNIYDKILYSVSFINIGRNLSFLIPLTLGGVCGLFSFSKIISLLLEAYPAVMYFCFIGMILGSLPVIYRRAKYDGIKTRNGVIFLCALLFMFLLAFIDNDSLTNKTLEQFGGASPLLLLWLFTAAFVSTIAMLLPGISGSMVMLLLGTYTVALEALSEFHITVIGAMGIGVLLGGFTGIKLIKIMLRFHPQALYCAILGLIIGSIFIIYPGFSFNAQYVLSVVFMCAFAVLTYLFSKKNSG